jgi:hypothetical protein
MACAIIVRWESEHREELQSKLKWNGGSNGCTFTLNITEQAILNCTLEELASLIFEIVSISKFDVVELSDFSSVAVLYREKKLGLPNLIVRPSPFTHTKLQATSNSVALAGSNVTSRAIIKRQKGSPTSGILAAAFAFFIIIVLGVMFYSGYGRRRGKRAIA